MTTDPQELNNRYNDLSLADVQRQLERRILDWMIDTSDVTPFVEDDARACRSR